MPSPVLAVDALSMLPLSAAHLLLSHWLPSLAHRHSQGDFEQCKLSAGQWGWGVWSSPAGEEMGTRLGLFLPDPAGSLCP